MTEYDTPTQERQETMKERAEHLIRRFEMLGGRIGAVVYDKPAGSNTPMPVLECASYEPFFAASTNKLAIAFAVANERPDGRLTTYAIGQRLDGAGVFDKQDQDESLALVTSATEVELIEDMLGRSGNTAAKLLKETVGAERINQLLEQHGLTDARLAINPDGTSHLGYATPEGLVRLICATVGSDGSAGPVISDAICRALANNTRPTGIRTGLTHDDQALLLGNGVQIFNKSGEYNGDEETGAPVRHDVGLIGTDDGRRVAYAVMAQSRAAILAEYTRHQLTAEILDYASGIRVTSARVHLARKAMRNLGIGRREP